LPPHFRSQLVYGFLTGQGNVNWPEVKWGCRWINLITINYFNVFWALFRVRAQPGSSFRLFCRLDHHGFGNWCCHLPDKVSNRRICNLATVSDTSVQIRSQSLFSLLTFWTSFYRVTKEKPWSDYTNSGGGLIHSGFFLNSHPEDRRPSLPLLTR
jgi:hypothetical protein